MRSTRTLAVAVALAATGLSLTPAVAMAAPTTVSASAFRADASTSLIDANAKTTLAIHKYLGVPSGAPADGTAQTVTLPPLAGVVFDVYRVGGVDLTTNAGWAAAKDLQGRSITAADVAAGSIKGASGTSYALTKATSVTTNAAGEANAAGLPVGLYLLNENLAASTAITNGGVPVATSSITPAAPSLVTLPMTNPAGDAWMYDVNVYPKNTSDALTKTVEDQGTIATGEGTTANADHTLLYTLSGSITPGLTGATMGSYVIADDLPAGTTFDSIRSVTAGGTTLAAGTDYTLWIDGAQASSSTADGPVVLVVMTAAGRDKVAAAKAADAAATVKVELVAVATADSGDLNNTGTLIPSNSWWSSTHPTDPDGFTPGTDDPGDGTPSNEVDSHLGVATLTKTDANGGATLAGATFDLYSAVIDRAGMADPKAADCTKAVTDANLRMTGLVTDAQGVLTMTGLQQSDYWNSAVQADQKIVYCLVETKAPTGYNLGAEPTAFFLQDVDTTEAVKVAGAVSVLNEKTNLENNLPLTGGNGASALGLGGLVLVGGTLAARAASRKRHADEDSELV